MDTPMEISFFFWPYTPALIRRMAAAAQRYRYDVVGVAATPGVAMDPWVAATLLAEAVTDLPVAICVSNLVSRHPAASAAAIASLDLLCGGRAVLGIGAGHSGVRNLGLKSSTAAEIERGVRFIKTLLRGGEVSLGDTTAALPWVTQAPRVFVAASHDRALTVGGAVADGVYINYGLHRENVRASEAVARRSAEASGRHPDALEIWQIAALDCSDDGESSRRALGKILAFITGYIVGARPCHARRACRAQRRGQGAPRALQYATGLGGGGPGRAARALRVPGAAPRDLRDTGRVPDAAGRGACGWCATADALGESRRGSGADRRTVRRAGAASGAVVGVTEPVAAEGWCVWRRHRPSPSARWHSP